MKKNQYKLVLSKNQNQKLTDWTCIIRNNEVQYIYVKWKASAAARPKEEEQQAITLLGREEAACPTQ